MIMNSPKTSTSLSQIENEYDFLMQNDTGYKSFNTVDYSENVAKQKRNPEILQIQDKRRTSLSPNQQDISEHSNKNQTKQKPETSQFEVENDQEKQFSPKNKFRKSVDNALFLDNFQSMFKKKTTSFEGNEDIQPPKKIKSMRRLHETNIYNHSQRQQQQVIQKAPSQIKLGSQNQQQQQISIQQRILQRSMLLQRLKNIHLFYKMNIDQQVTRRKKNDSIFIQMLYQNERIHLNKIQSLQNLIKAEKQQSKIKEKQKHIEKIEATTELYIKQKQKQLIQNIQLKKQLEAKVERIKQKQKYLSQILQEEKSLRQQVENNQKAQIKLKKWRKQVDTFMTKGHQQIEKLKRFYDKQDEYIDWKRSF